MDLIAYLQSALRARRAATEALTGRRTSRSVLVLFLLALSFAPQAASAHVRSTTGFSQIRQVGAGVNYQLSLEYEMLVATVGLGGPALHASSDEARRAALESGQQRIAAYLAPNLLLFVDGVRCPGDVKRVGVERRPEGAYATVLLSYWCPGSATGAYKVQYGVFSDAQAVVDEQRNVTDYVLGGEQGRFVFDSGHQELVVGQTSALASAARFVTMGFEHILEGADHVLFVLALLLGAPSAMGVLKVAAMFTVAHSITLGLAALGWVDVPSQVVEPLIALSIAYVAVENVLGSALRQRLFVVFGFGLLHGLGFARSMSFTDDISWRLLSSLLTFNVGIELGQALLIAIVFPLLMLVRRRRWSRPAHLAATAAIAVVGLFWFVERLLR